MIKNTYTVEQVADKNFLKAESALLQEKIKPLIKELNTISEVKEELEVLYQNKHEKYTELFTQTLEIELLLETLSKSK